MEITHLLIFPFSDLSFSLTSLVFEYMAVQEKFLFLSLFNFLKQLYMLLLLFLYIHLANLELKKKKETHTRICVQMKNAMCQFSNTQRLIFKDIFKMLEK